MKYYFVLWIVGFVFVGNCAFAQPFTLVENATAIRTPAITAVNSDTVIAFYVNDDDVCRAMFSLQNENLISPTEILRSDTVWRQSIIDVSLRGYEDWALAIQTSHSNETRLQCLFQSANGLFDHYVASSFLVPPPDYWDTTYLLNIYVAPWFADDWFVSYIYQVFSPFGESLQGGRVAIATEGGIEENFGVDCYYSENFSILCNHGPYFLRSLPTGEHKALSLYNANGVFTDSSAIIISDLDNDSTNTPAYPIGCAWTGYDLQLTRGGRMISFIGAGYEYDLSGIASVDTNGVCNIVRLPVEFDDPDALSFHPDFGWALLFHNQNSISVATVDTNGTVVTSPGVLYWHEGETAIMDADVTLTDDGKVVAVWSERDTWNQLATRLMLAWTDWDAQLDSPDQPPAPIPQSISLSAYPNPFNSEVQIEYSLPKAEDVSLSVYNVNGQLVESLVGGRVAAGEHAVNWTPKSGAGVYFVSLQTKTQRQTQKVLYLK